MMFALLYLSKKDHSKSIIAKEKITQLLSKKLLSLVYISAYFQLNG